MICICAICKNEHKYINDWVKYHLSLGFDKIYLYDNDDTTSNMLYQDNIDAESLNKMEIFDIRGFAREHLQQNIYTEFYHKHKDEFEWCLFIDIDEFLFGVKDIHKWINAIDTYSMKKNGTNQIRIKWRLFGDDNLIYRDTNIPIYQAIHHQVFNSLHRNLKQKGNLEWQGKFMLRGGLDNVVITSPHFASQNYRENIILSCYPSGSHCPRSKVVVEGNYSMETIYIHHYMTKTLSEFVEQKLNRNDAVYNKSLTLDYFWRINQKTPEKLEWLKRNGYL